MGVSVESKKEILGFYLGENEGAKFWLQVLTDLHNRGLQYILYQALTKEEAEAALDKLEAKWGKKYPIVFDSWYNNWENLSNYFKYPTDIRRIIYTTNIIESVHRQFRTLPKTKGAFPTNNSLLKLFYLGIHNAEKK